MSEWFTVPGCYPTEINALPNRSSRLTSSAEASPAKTSALPAVVLGSPESARAYGLSTSESFALFDHDSWSSRTLGLFGGGASTPYSGGWPKAGMMLNGRCYRRPTWEPRTFVKGSSSSRGFPTPTCNDAKSSGSRNLEGSKAHAGVSLTDAVKTGNSETPRELSMGALSPAWVELLMGFPLGHTEAPTRKPGSEG